jgi:metal transporter CNNM
LLAALLVISSSHAACAVAASAPDSSRRGEDDALFLRGARHLDGIDGRLDTEKERSWLASPPRLLREANESSPPPSSSSSTCNLTCCASFTDQLCPAASPASSGGSVEGQNIFSAVPTWAQILLIIALLVMSGLCAGLLLGLLSLDKTGLEIVMAGDDPVNARYAERIYPIRRNGNQLLCTLVLGNVGVNSLLSILMADKAGGLIGFLVSTFAIVIFGEIIPQSLCSLHALRIGSATAPLVRVLVVLLYPICAPLGYAMDVIVGEELVRTYSSGELLKMLEIQVEEKKMDPDTAKTMSGALVYKSIPVSKVMTPIENTFMLEVDDRLNFETVAKIFKAGYSRIPIYEIDRNNVTGLLFTKDLIFVDPEDSTRVGDFVEIFGRSLHVVWADDTLGDVLRDLKSGRSHMALVRDVNAASDASDPFYELKGIITLEDIIEEIMGVEIVDETDAYVDSSQSVLVDRPELTRRWASLRLLDSKIVDETLSFDEARAMAAHLSKNYGRLVELISDHQLHKLLSETPVSILPTAEMQAGQLLPDDLIYEKGNATDVCTLVMSGKITVVAGDDNFRSDVSSWGLLGAGALSDPSYAPDFSAYVSNGPCRCLRLARARFSAAVDASALERRAHPQEPATASSFSSPSSLFADGLVRRGRSPPPPVVEARNASSSPPPPSAPKTNVRRHTGILAALQKAEESAGTTSRLTAAPGKAKTVTFKTGSPPPSSSEMSSPTSLQEGSAETANRDRQEKLPSPPPPPAPLGQHHPVATKILLSSSYDEMDGEDTGS